MKIIKPLLFCMMFAITASLAFAQNSSILSSTGNNNEVTVVQLFQSGVVSDINQATTEQTEMKIKYTDIVKQVPVMSSLLSRLEMKILLIVVIKVLTDGSAIMATLPSRKTGMVTEFGMQTKQVLTTS